MLETVQFNLSTCPSCGPNVLLAGDLDDSGELVDVCAHCGTRIPDASRRRELGPASLLRYGYDVEGEREQLGCGGGESGGCGGSCGTKG
jgi:ribosomal protein S27AE